MYGPNGLGILFAKKWVDALPPYQGGGGMISEVKKDNITYATSPTKFEAGTMQTAEVVAFKVYKIYPRVRNKEHRKT